jgi:hypothetical protein
LMDGSSIKGWKMEICCRAWAAYEHREKSRAKSL